jgi:hypothetical protein
LIQVVQSNQQHIQHLLQQQQQSQRVTIRPQMVPNIPNQHRMVMQPQQQPPPMQRTPQTPTKVRQPRQPRVPKAAANGATLVRAVRAPGSVGYVRNTRPQQQQPAATYRLTTTNQAGGNVQQLQQQQPRASLGNVTLQSTGSLTPVLRPTTPNLTLTNPTAGQMNKLAQQGDGVQPPVITKITKNPRKTYVQPPQKAANANNATLEDLEESITAAVVAKWSNNDELSDNDDENKTVHLSDNTTMSLAEYNRKYIPVVS